DTQHHGAHSATQCCALLRTRSSMGRGRATFIRLLLAGGLAVVSVTDGAHAQSETNLPPSRDGPPPSNGNHKNNNTVWYVVGGVAVAIVGWMIGQRVFNPDPPPKLDQSPVIPPLDPISLPAPGQNPPPTRGQGKQANQGNQSGSTANLRN